MGYEYISIFSRQQWRQIYKLNGENASCSYHPTFFHFSFQRQFCKPSEPDLCFLIGWFPFVMQVHADNKKNEAPTNRRVYDAGFRTSLFRKSNSLFRKKKGPISQGWRGWRITRGFILGMRGGSRCHCTAVCKREI